MTRPAAPDGRGRLLDALQGRLGHRFADPTLLDRALTHASHAHESSSGGDGNNEALEFLGDAVLGFVVADLLHRRDPTGPEGLKSKRRASLVSAESLAERSERLLLPELLRLGRGEEKTGGRQKAKLWADAFEAVIAALYLDGGLEAAGAFVRSEFAADLDRPELGAHDAKSALQERLQARGREVPEYVVIAEEGPSHRRVFRVECRIDGVAVGIGEGTSKKAAQQEAARLALEAYRD
ncbi:MAG: ribonuclease III [Vicinamibacteria bacterium]